jgi:hypothetical protein
MEAAIGQTAGTDRTCDAGLVATAWAARPIPATNCLQVAGELPVLRLFAPCLTMLG